MITRRAFLDHTVKAALLAAASPAFARRGFGGLSNAGFYPAGHWIASPTGQPLTQVYPAPSGNASYARHLWAYWDGTNDVEFNLPLGVEFGAYPYVFSLVQGPPGMYIAEPIYNGFQNPNYGRLIWHPQGNASAVGQSWTVEVLVTDQARTTLTLTWTITTCGQWTSGNGYGFIFVDGTNGRDSNSGSYSAPLQTLGVVGGTAGAFGATYAASTYPGAICCIKTAGTYTLPAFADNGDQFQFNNATKPASLLALPGVAATISIPSAGPTATFASEMAVSSDDLFVQNLTFSGYNANSGNFRLASINANDRLTFDSIAWTGAGYGTSGTGNPSMFGTVGALSPGNYLFITDCSQVSSQTPMAFTGCDIYSYNHALIQRFSDTGAGQSSASVWLKSDCAYSTIRECYANYGGGVVMAFNTTIQNQYIITQNNDSCYNLGINVLKIGSPDNDGFTFGDLAVYRNSLIAGAGPGLTCIGGGINLEGPLIISATPTTGTGSLAAGTYYYAATAVGTGGTESAHRYGGGAAPNNTVAGSSNEISATLSATGEIVLDLSTVPYASSINIYRGTTSGGENQYVNVPNTTTTWTDDGTATWTSATPPASPGTGLSSARYSFNSNAIQSTAYTAPTGAAVVSSGNFIDNPASVMNATNGTIPSTNANYGLVGFQIA